MIVDAPAHGTGSAQELLLPVVEALATLRTSATMLTADAGYHSEANLAALAALGVLALIADPDMRKRDERFANREHHTTAPNPLHDKSGATKKALPLFTSSDVTYDADAHAVSAHAGDHRGPPRRVLPRARGRGDGDAHDADATTPRYAGGTRTVRTPVCHGWGATIILAGRTTNMMAGEESKVA